MMHRKLCTKLCRLCGKEKPRGTDVFKDKVKGAVLCSIINKYFPKEVINIGIADNFSKYVCMDCEHKLCTFDEFCLMVANVQKQLAAPTLEIDFAEDMLCHLKENVNLLEKSVAASTLPMDSQTKKSRNCELCGKRFRCQSHLERHKLIHTGQRPFTCDICAMSFNQQEVLNKHKQRHRGNKEFRCANCHQSFSFKVSLKSHMINFHTDVETESMTLNVDRTLSCRDCGKMFATRYKLQRHERCHTGERPYACNYCNRTFSQTGNLKLHETKCSRERSTIVSCQMSRLNDNPISTTNRERIGSHDSMTTLENPMSSATNCTNVVDNASLESQRRAIEHYQPMFITESEIQKTINETINSTEVDSGPSAYLIKNYENPIYIDDEIETMLDHDLANLDGNDVSSTEVRDKIPLCLKEPETPELLHSLLYDD